MGTEKITERFPVFRHNIKTKIYINQIKNVYYISVKMYLLWNE